MPKDKWVLLDTSVWIDYFSGKHPNLTEAVDALLSNTQVATAGIILAELTQGVRSEKEGRRIHDHFHPLHWIPGNDSHWEAAGQLAQKLRLAGRSINLTDCYIASLAHSADALIYTLDKHFSWIADVGGCRLFQVS